MTVCLLKLVSRYRFVTTQEQLKELVVIAAEKPESLEDTVNFVDCNLLSGISNMNRKAVVAFFYLLAQNRKLRMSIVLIANYKTRLDKRLEYQVTHKTKLVSKEIPIEEEIR